MLSDTLAERYAEFADILAEVDLAALDAKIARLTKLRAMVAALQGTARRPEPAPRAVADAPKADPEGDRRPRGFWPEFVYRVLSTTGGEMTVAEIASHLSDPKGNDLQIIGTTARTDRRIERVPDSSPARWRLVVTEPRLAEPA